jgi:hypothetical protein
MSTQSISVADLQKQIADLEAKLKAKDEEKSKAKISFKVSEKGACSVYGLQRFPVTLYKSQWSALLEHIDDLKAFLEDNDADLKEKPSK